MGQEATAVATAPAAAAPAATAPASPATAAPAAPAVATTAAPSADAPATATAPAATDPNAAPATTTEPAKPAEPAAAEVKYEFVAPAGAVLDPVVSTKFAEIAKELNLTPEHAQRVINEMAPLLAQNETARDATRIKAVVDQAAVEWAGQAKADKEFGGDNFDANIAIANEAFTAFGTPELKAVLEASGLKNHPELIRWAYRVGKQLTPDGKVVGGDAKAKPTGGTLEERAAAQLYKS